MTKPSWTVEKAMPQDNGVLLLTFATGEKRVYDCKPLMNTGLFKELRNTELFRQAYIDNDTVAWGKEIDIAPETLYADSEAV